MTRIVKDSEERRRDIIKAARELFQTKDYENTTMKELMNRLNIAKGTIYHYFSSKQELLEAVVEDIIDEELRKKELLLSASHTGNLTAMEKMRLLIIEDETSRVNERILNNLHYPENSEMHTKQLGRYVSKLAPLFAEVFEQGCVEGVFKTKHPLESAEFIIAGLQFLTDRGFYLWKDADLNRRIKAIPFIIEAQLGSIAGTFSFLNEKIKIVQQEEAI